MTCQGCSLRHSLNLFCVAIKFFSETRDKRLGAYYQEEKKTNPKSTAKTFTV